MHIDSIFHVILATAVIMVVLAILALVKGRGKLNISFFILGMLLATWNFLVVLWQGYGITVLARVNYGVVSFIPPAGMFFVIALFKLKNTFANKAIKVYMVLSTLMLFYVISTFFYGPSLVWYDSTGCKLLMMVYEFASLVIVFVLLMHYHGKITFKQERAKVGYVILANFVLFTGGMLDFAGGLGWHTLMYSGNIGNLFYAVMIFVAIFQMRLLDVGVVFKNLLVYTGIALLISLIYAYTADFIPKNKFPVMVSFFFIFTVLVLFFAKKLHGYFVLFLEKIGGLAGSEGAGKAFQKIKELNIVENEKIVLILDAIQKNIEMNVALYVKEGDYYIRKYATDDNFNAVIETAVKIDDVLIKYEERKRAGIDVLEKFEAEILVPVKYGTEVEGLISGKKQTADISFLEDEIFLLKTMAETIAVYYHTYSLQQKLVEEENMKRIGMMARQMAHEIKNPLAALWGAAQLLEGNGESERENVDIIRDEIRRLTAILDSWKDFSSEIKLNKVSVDIMELVSEVVKIINRQDKRVVIDFNRKSDEKFIVNVDTDKMKQVFINVVINAIDAMEGVDNPALGIDIVRKERFADIKIRDNGSGIKKEILSKIKQPLFTSKIKGTGLGLAVSDRIIKEHDGALIIESDGETYTEVTVSLPLE